MNAITLTVNGRRVSAQVEPRTQLADFLREELNLTGTHLGCEQGVCGACTVLIDGKPQRSCIASAAACDGADIRTIEGFDGDVVMGELREAFSANHALQCGFCTPGMLMSSRDIVTRLGACSERTIREELSGNLCRCTGYVGIVNAVHSVACGKTARGGAVAVAPVEAVAEVAPAPSASASPSLALARSVAEGAAAPAGKEGWTALSQRVHIPAPPAQVWPALKDMNLLARCLPGAEVTAFDGKALQGRMVVKFGPIKAAFGGDATVDFDDAAQTGTVSGAGRDSGSGSQVKGEIAFALAPEGEGSALDVTLRYRIAGPLAQFSRGALVQNLVGHLAGVFAGNLSAQLSGAPMAEAPASLSVWQMLKAMLKGWFAGRKS
ncbi:MULTISPECIES: xanthine dehydrogenase family Fe-S subunit [unclassified Xanthobacter]|uniref:xanthine dehydrogenase family Fe-S subunit n=1 Tax=unclassified Xanthobacter TaxID=2623496 RepID=UPI001EDE163F|nr:MULTISPECIES: 2Fe-2S iron-sulfur cluster-binding protein [unclassified Xanthobacter]